MNVVGYVRFSSAAQAEGTSLERQIEMVKAHAAVNGWTVTEEIVDEGRSAFKAKHKNDTAGLGRFLRDLDRGIYREGDILIVEALDRLSREQPLDALANVTRITSAGVRVEVIDAKLSLTRGGYETNIGSLVQLLVGAAQAHGESVRKSQLLTKTWAVKRTEGVIRTHHPHWMDKTKTLIDDRVETVKMIFDLADRGFGRAKIAGELNSAGHPTWGGSQKRKPSGDWSAQQVSTILKNRAVLGEAQAHSAGQAVGPVVADYYPQIISADQFERVNSIKTRRFSDKGSGRNSLSGNIFKGWFHCSCGRPMVIDPKKDRRYLRCAGSLKKACPHQSANYRRGMTYDQLEAGVLKAIKEMTLVDRSNDVKQRLQTNLAEAERVLEIVTANSDRLVATMLDGKKFKAIEDRLEIEEAKAVEAEAAIQSIKAELLKANRSITDHQNDVVTMYDTFLKVSDEDKVELRQRINQTLLRIIRGARLSRHLSQITISMNDHTVYQLNYEMRPDVKPRAKGGLRPMEDYHWKASRISLHDVIKDVAGSYLTDDAREDYFMLSDEKFDDAVCVSNLVIVDGG